MDSALLCLTLLSILLALRPEHIKAGRRALHWTYAQCAGREAQRDYWWDVIEGKL